MLNIAFEYRKFQLSAAILDAILKMTFF